jgi:hypothetical protein
MVDRAAPDQTLTQEHQVRPVPERLIKDLMVVQEMEMAEAEAAAQLVLELRQVSAITQDPDYR